MRVVHRLFHGYVVNAEAEETVNLPHPFSIASGQIIDARSNVDAFAFKGIQISAMSTGYNLHRFYFGNLAAVQKQYRDDWTS
jgi:hypothetical protein